MGYVIQIGEKKKKLDSIITRKLNDAPYFPENGIARENFHVSSDTNWGMFCDKTGLRNLFFDTHPIEKYYVEKNFNELTSETLEEIKKATATWKASHPNANAEVVNRSDPDYSNWTLAVLIWLEWWSDWAMKNCQQPHYSIR